MAFCADTDAVAEEIGAIRRLEANPYAGNTGPCPALSSPSPTAGFYWRAPKEIPGGEGHCSCGWDTRNLTQSAGSCLRSADAESRSC